MGAEDGCVEDDVDEDVEEGRLAPCSGDSVRVVMVTWNDGNYYQIDFFVDIQTTKYKKYNLVTHLVL